MWSDGHRMYITRKYIASGVLANIEVPFDSILHSYHHVDFIEFKVD